MTKYIEIRLRERGARCVARLLEAEAPRTCETLWSALPLKGAVQHAQYTRNEIHTLMPPLEGRDPRAENPTITPIPGDVCYFRHPAGIVPRYRRIAEGLEQTDTVVSVALFYARNNLLLSPDIGFMPGNVVATVEEGLDAMATACRDIFASGSRGEQLSFRRYEAKSRDDAHVRS